MQKVLKDLEESLSEQSDQEETKDKVKVSIESERQLLIYHRV